MKEWVLGLIIAVCVVCVVLFIIWYCDQTLRHGLRNGYKKLINTYFVQYITLISAAAAMYDLVVVACTVRKTDTERINGDKHVCTHKGRLGRCISDFSLAVLLSTYIFVAVVMVIAGWKANKEIINQLEPLVEDLRKGAAESKKKDKEESFFCPCGRKPQEEGQPTEKPVVKEN